MSKPMIALLIDAQKKEISQVEYRSLEDLHKLLGGYIELAYAWPNGDVLYVDEEGLLKQPQRYFRISVRPDQPLGGNGVLVGPEIGDTSNTEPPTMTVEQLRKLVRFLGE